MRIITLTLPYPPTTNHLYNTVKGRRIPTKKSREFKQQAGWLAKQQGAVLFTGSLQITFWLYRPKRIGDLDNRIKATQDALKGVCFKDDSQINEIHAYRFEDKHNPRIVVEIKECSL